MRYLKHIDLSENSIRAIAAGTFNGLYNLEELILRKNNLTKDVLIALGDSPTLRELDVSHNQINGHVDEELMPNLPNLEVLLLQNNRIKSVKSGCLAGNKLELHFSGISLKLLHFYKILIYFSGCPQIQTLNLSHNSIDVLEDGAFLLLSDLQVNFIKYTLIKNYIYTYY